MNKYIFGILFTTTLASGPAGAKPNRINIVYDLNGVTMTGGLPTPGFGEQLQIQMRDPRVRIFFFSTQHRAGIEHQLAGVFLPDGRSADRVGHIIDGSAMDDFDDGANLAAFKDLRAITLDPVELSNTILIDDSEYKAHPKQIANLLWLPDDVGYREVVAELPPALPVAAPPPPAPGWLARVLGRSAPPVIVPAALPVATPFTRRVNLRSDLMLGMINAAINLADSSHCSVSEALYHLQWGLRPDEKFDPKKYRLDVPRTHAALLRYGARVRRRFGCGNLLASRASVPRRRR